jgi:hypothetical protein
MKKIILMTLCVGLLGCDGHVKADLTLKASPDTVSKSGQVSVLDDNYHPATPTPTETKTDAFIKEASSMVYVQNVGDKSSDKSSTETDKINIETAPRKAVIKEILPAQELPVLDKTAIQEISPPISQTIPVKANTATTKTIPVNTSPVTKTPPVETGMAVIHPTTPVVVETGVSKFFSQ